jgi:hypothetical protein
VISRVEKVKIVGKNEKEVEVEAKIDTGAFSSSIDENLAKELGFEDIVNAFSEIDLSSYSLDPSKEAEIKKEIFKKYKPTIPDLEDVAIIFSASGNSIRPVIKMEYLLNEIKISSKTNISKRIDLKYPMLVGRRDLNKFLIDVTKQ